MIVSKTTTTSTRYHIVYEDSDIEKLIRADIDDWILTNLDTDEIKRAHVTVEYGSRYEGGVDANATVIIRGAGA